MSGPNRVRSYLDLNPEILKDLNPDSDDAILIELAKKMKREKIYSEKTSIVDIYGSIVSDLCRRKNDS